MLMCNINMGMSLRNWSQTNPINRWSDLQVDTKNNYIHKRRYQEKKLPKLILERLI